MLDSVSENERMDILSFATLLILSEQYQITYDSHGSFI